MISTHVLDTASGRPAAGVAVVLEQLEGSSVPRELARAATDADGRVRELVPVGITLAPGRYRLTFDTGAYFDGDQVECFFPSVSVVFTVRDVRQHHHVPLLVTPFGYTTYRGS